MALAWTPVHHKQNRWMKVWVQVAYKAKHMIVLRNLVSKLDIIQRQDSGQSTVNFTLKVLVSSTKTQSVSTNCNMMRNSSTKRSRLRVLRNIQEPTTQTDMKEKLRVMNLSKVVLQRKNHNWTMNNTNMEHIIVLLIPRATMLQEPSKIQPKI